MPGKKGVGGAEEEEAEMAANKRSYGDGVSWRRGAMLGKGSFGCVFMAKRSRGSCFPGVMAVKSAEVSVSGTIQKEREVMCKIKPNPYVIRCYGDETTTGENGEMIYNLLLEYGSGGTLGDMIRKSKGLVENEARYHARCLLRGLNHVHMSGYVHCDLKPDNVFMVPCGSGIGFRPKIGDFGLSKRGEQSKKRKFEAYWRGTPMYLSPEVVKDKIQEAPSDIWALGCIVLEMLTGKPPWSDESHLDVLKKIEEGQLPKVPSGLSKQAEDFLKRCFVKNDMYRLTAEMLLNHPFVEGLDDDDLQSEDVSVVEDVNLIDSILLVSDIGDGFGSWSSGSEDEDSIYYWSDEDEEELLLGEENSGVIAPNTKTVLC